MQSASQTHPLGPVLTAVAVALLIPLLWSSLLRFVPATSQS